MKDAFAAQDAVIAILQSQVQSTTSLRAEYEESLVEVAAERDAMKAAYDTASSISGLSSQQLREAVSRISALEEMLSSVRQEHDASLAASADETEITKAANVDAEMQLAEKSSQVDDLLARMQDFSGKLAALRAENVEKISRISQLENEISDAREERARIEEIVTSTRVCVKLLEELLSATSRIESDGLAPQKRVTDKAQPQVTPRTISKAPGISNRSVRTKLTALLTSVSTCRLQKV